MLAGVPVAVATTWSGTTKTFVVAAVEVFVFEPLVNTFWVSFTTSENVYCVEVDPPGGAVNVGICAVGSDRVTAGPAVCVHW